VLLRRVVREEIVVRGENSNSNFSVSFSVLTCACAA
jgi:hypothetical protein